MIPAPIRWLAGGLLASAVVAAVLTRCANDAGHRPSRLVYRIETANAHPAASLPELAAESDLVVRGAPTGRRSYELVSGVPFVVSEVRVTGVVAGIPGGSTVRVRQVGGPGVETPGAPLLVPGRSYLLFLQRFDYGPDSPTDQYVVTGNGAGLLAASGP